MLLMILIHQDKNAILFKINYSLIQNTYWGAGIPNLPNYQLGPLAEVVVILLITSYSTN